MPTFFLIGFMGAGKSTLGQEVAHELQIPFVDLDQCIEKRTAQSIRNLFKEHGQQHFRQVERQELRRQICSIDEGQNAIIATGGGTPCYWGQMDWMMSRGVVIYLHTPFEALWRRLKAGKDENRPLVGMMDKEALRTLFEMRLHVYQRATELIQADAPINQVAAELRRLIQQRS